MAIITTIFDQCFEILNINPLHVEIIDLIRDTCGNAVIIPFFFIFLTIPFLSFCQLLVETTNLKKPITQCQLID